VFGAHSAGHLSDDGSFQIKCPHCGKEVRLQTRLVTEEEDFKKRIEKISKLEAIAKRAKHGPGWMSTLGPKRPEGRSAASTDRDLVARALASPRKLCQPVRIGLPSEKFSIDRLEISLIRPDSRFPCRGKNHATRLHEVLSRGQ
jgi:hypothetical protein